MIVKGGFASGACAGTYPVWWLGKHGGVADVCHKDFAGSNYEIKARRLGLIDVLLKLSAILSPCLLISTLYILTPLFP